MPPSLDLERNRHGTAVFGFHTWTSDEIARFEERWIVGARERLAFAILLFGTTPRDAAMLGRQHIRDGVISFRTAKTGQQVTIPLLSELAAVIDATTQGRLAHMPRQSEANLARTPRQSEAGLAFIATPSGAPMTKESFGTWFRLACKAAGVPGRAHGLRKAGATRAANNGATEAELEAIFGWRGGRMASLYTRQADRVRLARR
jgi:integrase